jgi:hypothetical protein
MPMNSDHRCMGISLVALALLQGEPQATQGCEPPADVAQHIYDRVTRGAKVRFSRQVCLSSGPQAIESPAALERLSTIVADLYKQDHFALIAAAEGLQKLEAANASFIASRQELDQILDADSARLDAFCARGYREFADGRVEGTAHVVLICKDAAGKKFVYDPNDPGKRLDCRLEDSPTGVWIEWTCRYRDTGQVTTQSYNLIRKEVFFKLAFGKA